MTESLSVLDEMASRILLLVGLVGVVCLGAFAAFLLRRRWR